MAAHKKVPYATHLEVYMGCGMGLLALGIAEAAIVAHAEPALASLIERWFFGVCGAVWVLLHGLVVACGDTGLLRVSWLSLARMEVGKLKPYEQWGGEDFDPKRDRLLV